MYFIAGVELLLHVTVPIRITENFLPFLCVDYDKKTDSSEMPKRYEADFREISDISKGNEQFLVYNQDFKVYKASDGAFVRIYHDHDQADTPYAITRIDAEKHKVEVRYLREKRHFFSESGNSFFHIGWETLMIQEKRVILHAACIDTAYGGVLFSGPSGIGKSTQADLWRKYEDAILLNGDRPIVAKEQGRWKAYGSPYAGSSKCYVNSSCGITAIVFLLQGTAGAIRRLNGSEAFRRIFEVMTVNSWDSGFVNRACDMAQEMIREIPVYELQCRPDQTAVELLKTELEEVI